MRGEMVRDRLQLIRRKLRRSGACEGDEADTALTLAGGESRLLALDMSGQLALCALCLFLWDLLLEVELSLLLLPALLLCCSLLWSLLALESFLWKSHCHLLALFFQLLLLVEVPNGRSASSEFLLRFFGVVRTPLLKSPVLDEEEEGLEEEGSDWRSTEGGTEPER